MSQAVHSDDPTLHINELLINLTKFQTLLEQEASILKLQDANQLYDILIQKQTIADEINQQVTGLESQYGLDSNLYQLTENEKFQQLSAINQANLKKVTSLAESCKDLNMRNGYTIQALESLNTELSNLFNSATQASSVSLYTARGERKHGGNKASLGKA